MSYSGCGGCQGDRAHRIESCVVLRLERMSSVPADHDHWSVPLSCFRGQLIRWEMRVDSTATASRMGIWEDGEQTRLSLGVRAQQTTESTRGGLHQMHGGPKASV